MKELYMKIEEMPEKYTELVGQRVIMAGSVFGNNEIEETEFDILDWRWGHSTVMNMKEMKERHPTVEYLVKNENMRRSRWTKCFPVKEIDLNNDI